MEKKQVAPTWLKAGKQAQEALADTGYGLRQKTLGEIASELEVAAPTLRAYLLCTRFYNDLMPIDADAAAKLCTMPYIAVEALARLHGHDPIRAQKEVHRYARQPVSTRELKQRISREPLPTHRRIAELAKGLRHRFAWLMRLVYHYGFDGPLLLHEDLKSEIFFLYLSGAPLWTRENSNYAALIGIDYTLSLPEVPVDFIKWQLHRALLIDCLDIQSEYENRYYVLKGKYPSVEDVFGHVGRSPSVFQDSRYVKLGGELASIAKVDHALIVGSVYSDENNRRARLKEYFIRSLAAAITFDSVSLILPDRTAHLSLVEPVRGIISDNPANNQTPLADIDITCATLEMIGGLDFADDCSALKTQIKSEGLPFEPAPRISFRARPEVGQVLALAPDTLFEALFPSGLALELLYQYQMSGSAGD